MSKLSSFLSDLFGLALALSVLVLCAYAFGAYLGEGVALESDVKVVATFPFLIGAIVGACMAYNEAVKMCKAISYTPVE